MDRKATRCLVLTFVVAFLTAAFVTDGRAADEVYLAVLCSPNWKATVSQRYDKRDRFDWIVKRTWVTRCA